MADDTTASATTGTATEPASLIEKAVAEGGAYEVLRKRLGEQGRQLRERAEALNAQRLQTFGSPSLHWVKVTVDPASANLFQIEPVIVAQPR